MEGRESDKDLIDPKKSTFITIVGRKGSGKSVLASTFWATYPFDRMVVDVTGDALFGDPKLTRTITDPLPGSWPEGLGGDDERSSLRYRPDSGDPAYVENMDHAAGLAFEHGRSLLWLDEITVLVRPSSGTPPNMRRVLYEGRHRDLTVLFCTPRPQEINTLVLSQADFLYLFAIPHPRDRERIAETIGVNPKELGGWLDQLARYEYLRWNSIDQELTFCAALPTGVAKAAARSDVPGDYHDE